MFALILYLCYVIYVLHDYWDIYIYTLLRKHLILDRATLKGSFVYIHGIIAMLCITLIKLKIKMYKVLSSKKCMMFSAVKQCFQKPFPCFYVERFSTQRPWLYMRCSNYKNYMQWLISFYRLWKYANVWFYRYFYQNVYFNELCLVPYENID